ncbi:MAG: cytochrome P450, partial [Pikeienuella sp.]
VGWAVYLLASDKHTQARAAAEVGAISPPPEFGDIRRLAFTRDVYRETLRLYPPVPMMVRETARKENFRNRKVAKGSIFIMSPWHLHRHERLWSDGDVFDPDRWARADEADSRRDAYMPFSAGPRVCSGAGFAMLEGVLFLATILRRFELSPVADRQPAPITQLTVRSETGIWLSLTPRR